MAAVRQGSYYLVPRRAAHVGLAVVLLVVVAGPLAAWTLTPRWMPLVPTMLDADRPIADPDVVVVKTAGEGDADLREAARLATAGQVKAVAVLGIPFTPDDLLPPPRSRRVDELVRLGVPRERVIEIYRGEDLYEEMAALRDVAHERGWQRVLLFVDALGSRRNLLVAGRILGTGGIAFGQTTFPLSWFDAGTWWRGGQPRTIVFVRAMQLALTLLSSRA